MSWEMTEILVRVFSGIFLCSVTGSVLFLYWKPVSRYLEKKGDAKLNYTILKIIVVSFFVPVLSVVFEDLSHKTWLFSTTSTIKQSQRLWGVSGFWGPLFQEFFIYLNTGA